ncbi:MAG: LysR substrate-binding domain-containing protein [Bacilli bacterium]
MDFQQLKTFHRVASHLNFTRAAEELHLSQPAVSRQIEALEATLGLPLFDRSGRKISLTEAGYVLFRQCEQILRLVDSTRTAIDTLKNLESGSLHIGLSSTIGNYILPHTILQFTRKYPGIQTKISISCSRDVLQKLESGAVDIAVVSGPITSTALYVEPFLQDEIVLAMGDGHPLSQLDQITVDSIRQFPLLLRSEGSGTREAIARHAARLGWQLPLSIEFETTEAIKQAIMAGSGVGFLSTFAVRFEMRYGLIRPVRRDPFRVSRSFFIASHKARHPSPGALAFKTFIRKMTVDRPLCGLDHFPDATVT